MPSRERYILAAASGPAADAIEAGVVSITGRRERLAGRILAAERYDLDAAIGAELLSISAGRAAPGAAAALDEQLADRFADACEQTLALAGLPRAKIVAVALAGQQAPGRHRGRGRGRQPWRSLGSPARVAQKTGWVTAGDFRRSDRAAGGPGAAIWAWPIWRTFADERLSRVAVHLGGVVSLTFLGAGAASCEVVAYDVGPGTLLLDGLAGALTGEPMDRDGALAARGQACLPLVNEMLAHPFYHLPAGRCGAGEDWQGLIETTRAAAARHACSDADLLHSATEVVARSVSRAVETLTERPHQVILTGGGARNIQLAGRIRELLSPCSTWPADKFELPADRTLPLWTALLAAGRLDKFAAHCPSAGGADRPAVLGAIYLP